MEEEYDALQANHA
jgi:hypothetical protein